MMTKKRMMVGVAAALALAALVGCQNSKDFEIRGGVLTKYVGAGGKVKIPSSVTTIEYGAFSDCTGLTSVSIPSSVTKIESGAFLDCISLASVTIPKSVTEIGGDTFSACTGLTNVTIPNGVTEIGVRAFQGCTSLTSVTIPDSVTGIGESAFRECTSLAGVTIPNGVTVIGNQTYVNRFGDTQIIHSSSFEGNLANVYDGNGKQAGTYVRNGNTWTKR